MAESEKNVAVAAHSFEDALSRLQEIVSLLEKGDLPLEKGMQLYKEGMTCVRSCRDALQKARHEVTVWQNGEETPFVQPLHSWEAAE